MKQFFLVFLLIVGPAIQSFAEVYKWTDEEGNIQYTQTPPPAGTQSTTVTGVPTNSISGSPSSSVQQTDNASEGSQGSKKETCLKAQDELKSLRTGNVVIPDKKKPDKFIAMPEEMRRERESETTDYLERHCKDFALPQEPPKHEGSACDQARDYLAQLTSKKDWLIPDPENPEQFVKIDQETRQKKIDEAQTLIKDSCSKQ